MHRLANKCKWMQNPSATIIQMQQLADSVKNRQTPSFAINRLQLIGDFDRLL